jgi:hypothetical protein
MSAFRQEQVDAANRFADAAIDALKDAKGVHAETAVAATARMAGSFLFRSFGFKLEGVEPGQPVLSEEANEQGPELVNILAGVLAQMGVELDVGKLADEPGPDHKPLLGFLETQRKLEPAFAGIRDELGLSLREAAESAAAATAVLIRRATQLLDAHVAFHIAAYGFVEGTKTVP